MKETKSTPDSTEMERLHSIVRQFHVEEPEMGMCLGAECPHKDCRVCAAAKNGRGRIFRDTEGNAVESEASWDSYRASVKNGYYTTSFVEVEDPVTHERKFVYTRPGG